MRCRLFSQYYRLSPLLQGRLEIECQVVINSPATMLHSKLAKSYLTLVNDFYVEPTEERVVEKLFDTVTTYITPYINIPVRKKKKATSSPSRDIREILASP